MAYITWAGHQYVMPKIIVVTGPGSSGKTTSIREFLETRDIRYMKTPGDVKVVIPVKKRNTVLAIGVASGGDTVAVLRKNFDFLIPRNCDVIVCAAKSHGSTIQYIQNTFRGSVIPIPIVKLNAPTPAQIAIKNAGIVNQIVRNI